MLCAEHDELSYYDGATWTDIPGGVPNNPQRLHAVAPGQVLEEVTSYSSISAGTQTVMLYNGTAWVQQVRAGRGRPGQLCCLHCGGDSASYFAVCFLQGV